jgi:HAD superfamily hydrolase (TIGR01490 family)
MRLALFDFDGTLIPFDSGDAWVDALARAVGRPRRGLDLARRVLFPHSFLRREWHKRLVLLRLRGLPLTAAVGFTETYWREAVRPRLLAAPLARLDAHRREGFLPVLATANYEPLARVVAHELGFAEVVATRLASRGPVYTGTLDGADCRGTEKARRVRAAFAGREVDWRGSVAYGDSRADLPLLALAGRGVVVHTGPAPAWARDRERLPA